MPTAKQKYANIKIPTITFQHYHINKNMTALLCQQ
jgi:hypothetical protein